MIGSVCICGYVTKQQLIFKHIVKWGGEEGRVAPPAYSSLPQTCMSVFARLLLQFPDEQWERNYHMLCKMHFRCFYLKQIHRIMTVQLHF